MQPITGHYGVLSRAAGCEQAIHDTVVLAASEEEALGYVKCIHGESHWVIPVVDGRDYG